MLLQILVFLLLPLLPYPALTFFTVCPLPTLLLNTLDFLRPSSLYGGGVGGVGGSGGGGGEGGDSGSGVVAVLVVLARVVMWLWLWLWVVLVVMVCTKGGCSCSSAVEHLVRGVGAGGERSESLSVCGATLLTVPPPSASSATAGISALQRVASGKHHVEASSKDRAVSIEWE